MIILRLPKQRNWISLCSEAMNSAVLASLLRIGSQNITRPMEHVGDQQAVRYNAYLD